MNNIKFLSIDGHQIPVKNLDKIFWPGEGITKGDVMRFYAQIWPALAPHLLDRPLSLVRYPEGIKGNYFYQKNCPDAPVWVETVPIKSGERVLRYSVANNLAALIWGVNLGCIEIHPWLSKKENLGNPTYVIFDLDPMPPAQFPQAVQIALAVKKLLDQLNLQAFPKTSGATGIHIYLPVKPVYAYEKTSSFVRKIGRIIINVYPDLATDERIVKKRAGKVYIDHLQNLKGKTIASVYSIRPFPGAPVSTPVSWDELPLAKPADFTRDIVLNRIRARGDLFRPLLELAQILPEI
ncbi:MAG: non-homologous end-joining DNA ligase [Bacillota bacterium]